MQNSTSFNELKHQPGIMFIDHYKTSNGQILKEASNSSQYFPAPILHGSLLQIFFLVSAKNSIKQIPVITILRHRMFCTDISGSVFRATLKLHHNNLNNNKKLLNNKT